jgi:DNA-binding PadR family transcriptional regulator
LDEPARITQKILRSILGGNQKVGDIRIDTRLSPKSLAKYLKQLKKQGLIEFPKTKRGESKPCSITNAGISWLTNIPLNENLQILSAIVDQLRDTKNRENFKKTQSGIYLRNTMAMRDYFIERVLKGDNSPEEFPIGMDVTEPDQLFRKALKKILTLHMYLASDQSSEEIERSLEKDFLLFSPGMKFWFGWHLGAFPNLEREIRNADQYFQNESNKEKRQSEVPNSYRETHLLGLDGISEKVFDEYLGANKAKREKLLTAIENQVGWSVGKYLGDLSRGKEGEIAKYVDENERPFLRKFIRLFVNHGK